MKGYVTVATFARRIGRSSRTVRRWCERGIIPGAWNVGAYTSWMIPSDALADLVADMTETTEAQHAPPNPETMTP